MPVNGQYTDSESDFKTPNYAGLTQRQRALLEFIHVFSVENGIPPSFDQMKLQLGLKSKSGVHRLVSALAERNKIIRYKARARSISVVYGEPEVDLAGHIRAVLGGCVLSAETQGELLRIERVVS